MTRYGRPAFVLVHPDYLESLEETLDIINDADLLENLERSRQEAADGLAEPLPLL